MLRLRSLRPNVRRQRRAFPNEAQQLEVRMVPTGVVTLAQIAAGLKITGDVHNNRVQIDVLSEGATIQAIDNDTVIRVGKVNYPAGTVVQLGDSATFLGNLAIDLKQGDDVLVVNVGEIDDELPPIIQGAPSISLGDATNAVISGNLSITMGAGNDDVALIVENGNISIGGNATVDLGSGNDRLLGTPYDDEFFSGGEGGLGFLEGFFGIGEEFPEDVDTAREIVDLVVNEFGGLKVTGNLNVLAGAGNDGVGMIGVVAGRDLSVDMGAGEDLFGGAIIGAGRELKLNAGSGHDDALLYLAYSGSKTTLNTGAGNDVLFAFGVQSTKDVSVNMGAGDDVLLVALLVPGPDAITTLDGGSDRDVISDLDFSEGSTFVAPVIAPRTTVKNFESNELFEEVLDQLGQDFEELFFRFE